MALKPNITLIRGDSTSITFTLTENNTPVDLTGSTVFFTAKPALTNDISDNTAVISVEVTSHTDPENGETVIPLTSSDTDVTPGDYYYDIQVKNGSSITSIKYQLLEVIADVTRRTS
jgi:hypothetical protein